MITFWGGENRINDDFWKGINRSPLVGSWECSVNEDGPSFVASGEYEGKSLKEMLDERYQTTIKQKQNKVIILVKL